MRWMEDLYIGGKAVKSRRKLISRIRRNKPAVGAYVLLLSEKPVRELSAVNANLLRLPYFTRKEELTVVGLAEGKKEAMELMSRIAEECWKETGRADLAGYVSEKLRREGMTQL